MQIVETRKIWSVDQIPNREESRIEFPHLIRFREHWYCCFREGKIHMNHPSGRCRVIRSADGEQWETAALFEWNGGDVRETRLAVTAENRLMANTSIYFVSDEPREIGYSSGGAPYESHYQLDKPGTPEDDLECNVARQSATWLSADGKNWGSINVCPTGINNWRWDVVWNHGMGYSIGYCGKDHDGTLYRTRDGKNWRVLKRNFFPEGQGNEASLAFGKDGTAWCLLRGGPSPAMIGIAEPPFYQNWTWRHTTIAIEANDPTYMRSKDYFRGDLGGPKMIRLQDGRLMAAGRANGRVTLFRIDHEKAMLTKCLELEGTSYPGLVEHEQELWITYGSLGTASEIHLARVSMEA